MRHRCMLHNTTTDGLIHSVSNEGGPRIPCLGPSQQTCGWCLSPCATSCWWSSWNANYNYLYFWSKFKIFSQQLLPVFAVSVQKKNKLVKMCAHGILLKIFQQYMIIEWCQYFYNTNMVYLVSSLITIFGSHNYSQRYPSKCRI